MQIGEHRSELGNWRTAQRAADPHLGAYFHGYFASSSELARPIRERHLPSLEVPLFLNFGAPHCRLNSGEPGSPAMLDGAWITGLHDGHYRTEAVGERNFMVVRFTPLGAHLFFGLPMHLLANQTVSVANIDSDLARLLMSRAGTAGNWSDRFAAMDSLIAERVARKNAPASVEVVWNGLVAADGRVTLSHLASDIDCSYRSLIAQFRTCVGFPPKTIARLLRFGRVVELLQRHGHEGAAPANKPYIESEAATGNPGDPVRWADVATDLGYFDQPHLIKEFRRFAGATPTSVLRQISG